jgi:hypothetical protein
MYVRDDLAIRYRNRREDSECGRKYRARQHSGDRIVLVHRAEAVNA